MPKIDAILLPHGYASRNKKPGSGITGAVQRIVEEFKPILGVECPLEIRDVPGAKFIAPQIPTKDHAPDATHHTLLFAKSHELAGKDRYVWIDRGDGVKYGTLVDQETGEPVTEVVPAPEAPNA